MSNTFTNLIYHVVYSTKFRRATMTADLQSGLFPYIGGIIRNRDGIPLEMGGTADHIHILTKLSPKYAVMDVLRDIKSESSKWVNEQGQQPHQRFEWQTGYGAFSVSTSQIEEVRNYIQNQEAHHRKITFEEEFLAFLRKHDIEFELKYAFDEEHVA